MFVMFLSGCLVCWVMVLDVVAVTIPGQLYVLPPASSGFVDNAVGMHPDYISAVSVSAQRATATPRPPNPPIRPPQTLQRQR